MQAKNKLVLRGVGGGGGDGGSPFIGSQIWTQFYMY